MTQIGGYELIKQIGKGGMGRVWLGVQKGLPGASSQVAIKLMSPPEGANVEAYRRQFEAEARVSVRLRHSNVVSVFQTGEDRGECFLVMEWIDGLDLRELMTQLFQAGNWLTLPMVAYIVGEVLRGLAYAQTVTEAGSPMGVVHRDISPSNILVSTSGEVKITDFGVARLASDKTTRAPTKDKSAGPGKVFYMAPEQVRTDAQSRSAAKLPAIDLYAVGAILHELIERRRLRDTPHEHEAAAMALAGDVPELVSARDVPAELDHLRRALLDPNPQTRPQRAEQALELLMRWPGYRNASLELGRMCRQYMGVAAPRSSPELPAVNAPTPGGEITTIRVGSGAHSAAQSTTQPGPPSNGAAGSGYSPLLVGGLAVGLLGVVGIGGVAVWKMTPAPAETPAAAAPVHADNEPEPEPHDTPAEPSPAPAPSVEPEEPAKDEPPPAEDPAVQPQPEPEPTPAAATPSPEPGPEKAKPTAKATVTFKTGDFTFVWIKVRGKVHALEPTKEVKLPAGRHKVSWRMKETDPWKSGGFIKIEPGGTYDVRMEKPGKAALSKK